MKQQQLLNDELRHRLPPLDSPQAHAPDPQVQAKFYLPGMESWIWYVIAGEQQGEDYWFLVWCVHFNEELGEISLRELEELAALQGEQSPPQICRISGMDRLEIEVESVVRDDTFQPAPLSAVKQLHPIQEFPVRWIHTSVYEATYLVEARSQGAADLYVEEHRLQLDPVEVFPLREDYEQFL